MLTKNADALRGLRFGANDFDLVVPEALLEQSRRTQRLFNIVMGCIAGISLLVGGIGIMNIMLATVTERTKEIGIRRAIGARQADIVWQFLVESSTLSLTGGILGMLIGLSIALLVSVLTPLPYTFDGAIVTIAFIMTLAVGLIFGTYPALRAARLDPVQALQSE